MRLDCSRAEEMQAAIDRGNVREELRVHSRDCALCGALLRMAAEERLLTYLEGPEPCLEYDALAEYADAPERLDEGRRATIP